MPQGLVTTPTSLSLFRLLLTIAQTEVYLDKLKVSFCTFQAFFSSASKTLSGSMLSAHFPSPLELFKS